MGVHMIVYLLCFSLGGGLPECDPFKYETFAQCNADGQFRAYMYQRWLEYRYECLRRTEV